MASFRARLSGVGKSVSRFCVEIAAFTTAGIIASQFAYTPTEESIKQSSPALFEQSQSLEAEFNEILSHIESIYYSKLAATNEDSQFSKTRIIAQADLDEFRRNITDEFNLFDEFCDRKESMLSSSQSKVIEEYRVVPLSELKQMKLDAAKRKKYPKIWLQGIGRVKIREEKEKSVIVDTLQTMVDIDNLVKKYAYKINQQELRIERAISKAATQLKSTDDAANDEIMSRTIMLVGYGSMTILLDSFFKDKIVVTFQRRRFFFGLCGCYLFYTFFLKESYWKTSKSYLSLVDNYENSHIDNNYYENKNTFLYKKYFYPSDGVINRINKTLDITDDTENENENYVDSLFDYFIEDNTYYDDNLSMPSIWIGATSTDPFTLTRLKLNMITKPIFDDAMFRMLLFSRLSSYCGNSPALIATSIIYAIYYTDSMYDITSKLNHATVIEAFMNNFRNGGFIIYLYSYTGNIFLSIFANVAIQVNSLLQEYSSRSDLIKEKLEIWPYLKKIMLLHSVSTYYLLCMKCSIIKNGFAPDFNGVTENKGEPTQGIKNLINSLIENFSTIDIKKNKINNENENDNKNVIKLTTNDMYDFIESFYYVTNKKTLFKDVNRNLLINKFPLAYPKEINPTHHSHYSYTNNLPPNSYGLRREDYLKDLLNYLYPNGLTIKNIEFFLLLLFIDATYGENVDVKKISDEIMKWEKLANSKLNNNKNGNNDINNNHDKNYEHGSKVPNDDDFLDLMQMIYTGFLNRVEVESVKFGIWRSAGLLERLAGRKANAHDIREYQKELGEWMIYANKRAEIDALLAVGITPHRFAKLLKLYDKKYNNNDYKDNNGVLITNENEIGKLRNEWKDYFAGPLFRRRIHRIVDPFKMKN